MIHTRTKATNIANTRGWVRVLCIVRIILLIIHPRSAENEDTRADCGCGGVTLTFDGGRAEPQLVLYVRFLHYVAPYNVSWRNHTLYPVREIIGRYCRRVGPCTYPVPSSGD